MSAPQPSPALFADKAATVAPIGDLMEMTICGQRFVMTRHYLLATMERSRRAIVNQDMARADVVELRARRAAEKAGEAA